MKIVFGEAERSRPTLISDSPVDDARYVTASESDAATLVDDGSRDVQESAVVKSPSQAPVEAAPGAGENALVPPVSEEIKDKAEASYIAGVGAQIYGKASAILVLSTPVSDLHLHLQFPRLKAFGAALDENLAKAKQERGEKSNPPEPESGLFLKISLPFLFFNFKVVGSPSSESDVPDAKPGNAIEAPEQTNLSYLYLEGAQSSAGLVVPAADPRRAASMDVSRSHAPKPSPERSWYFSRALASSHGAWGGGSGRKSMARAQTSPEFASSANVPRAPQAARASPAARAPAPPASPSIPGTPNPIDTMATFTALDAAGKAAQSAAKAVAAEAAEFAAFPAGLAAAKSASERAAAAAAGGNPDLAAAAAAAATAAGAAAGPAAEAAAKAAAKAATTLPASKPAASNIVVPVPNATANPTASDGSHARATALLSGMRARENHMRAFEHQIMSQVRKKDQSTLAAEHRNRVETQRQRLEDQIARHSGVGAAQGGIEPAPPAAMQQTIYYSAQQPVLSLLGDGSPHGPCTYLRSNLFHRTINPLDVYHRCSVTPSPVHRHSGTEPL
ncbi:hypothetical protein BDK51DRAFT_46177 [Blyttiomyces helicus]|uniref:Uncharacterized protein n=1 Tax=Blyttiomyces helicus TaxID=388810 RepID=A0A4P9W4R0_9FUNG|nr:hypothetical protein BDK51DRAFT_46177 [Blyttiomyces helicus]|eukprot:RKO85700.1 hypothetical protein BDK51DRAFT_46177 [Blyttiomyces helicus]